MAVSKAVRKQVKETPMMKGDVIVLSDEELQIKVAELRGWQRVGLLNDGLPYGIPPEDWKHPDDPFPPDEINVWLVPDYPNDIKAAWELAYFVCKEKEFYLTMDQFYNHDWNIVIGPFGMLDKWIKQCKVEVPYKELPLGITRAFILAMTQETVTQGGE